MVRKSTFVMVTAATALIVSLSPALAEGNSLFKGGPRYDGTIKITKVTGANCPPVIKQLKGKTSDAVYRTKIPSSGKVPEAISVQLPLAGAALIVAGGDGYFKGENKSLSGNFIMDAWPNKLPSNSVANLTFTPSDVVGGTTSNFTFRGSISNYAFPGCTVDVFGDFDLRTVP